MTIEFGDVSQLMTCSSARNKRIQWISLKMNEK
jgi:hypothetical protein